MCGVTLVVTSSAPDWKWSTLGRLLISFVYEGFPLQRLQIEELFVVMVSFYVFPTLNIFNFLVNFTF